MSWSSGWCNPGESAARNEEAADPVSCPARRRDMTFTEGPGGEHTTSVCGEGRAPGLPHVRRVAAGAGIETADAAQIVNEVRDAVSRWMSFARTCGVRKSTRERIQKQLCLFGEG